MKIWRVLRSDIMKWNDVHADSYEVGNHGDVVFFSGDVGIEAFASGQWTQISLIQDDDDATLVVE